MNPVEGTGPGRDAITEIIGFFNLIFSDFKFTRMQTLLCGDSVVVISRFEGTVKGGFFSKVKVEI